MAYRNGTYVAFHAEGTSDPTASDMKYYRLLEAWDEHHKIEFCLINSHDKTAAVRDTSKRETLAARLRERLNNSRNMLLIIGQSTRNDTDWIPFEIEYAVDDCEIPIIAAYPGYLNITKPSAARSLWPSALEQRIDNGTARVIHVSFRKEPILAAITQFDHDTLPQNGLVHYGAEVYQRWGL